MHHFKDTFQNPNPNAIIVEHPDFRYRLSDLTEARQTFRVKTTEGVLEFVGTRTEARDYFRERFPANVLIFRQVSR